MLKRIPAILLFFVWFSIASAQIDPHRDLDTLCSPHMAGRGYVDKGLEKASAYIANEFKTAGLEPLDKSWYQDFSMSVNTFPGAMEVKVEGRELKPGEDFLVKSSANSLKGTFTL
ncbi:MAG: arginyl aminopeptidase, partial [Bacteroidota bacterium]|nr:arginyl aminopeptidase [Bacteroidota bacterium]MDX5430677.1 arginyl aminopeptidase [Bacteroidota bacterium]MDX5469424.1 arginyl aminopeptidase [Bacteroidota bacterium]